MSQEELIQQVAELHQLFLDHVHTGTDVRQVSYNNLTDKPSVITNPMTTLGDLIYGGASGTATRLTGDVSNTRKFLRELSSGGVAAAPVWDTIQATDITSGTLGVTNGGTGAATLTLNNVLLGNGTSAVQFVAPGSTGNVLQSNGSTWVSASLTTGLSFMQQKIGFGFTSGTTSATRYIQVSCTAPTGGADSNNPFYMFFNHSDGTSPKIYKCIIDATTGIINASTTISPALTIDTGTKMYGVIIGSFVYVSYSSGAAFAMNRFDLGTLANSAAITPDVSPGAGLPVFTDGTNMYFVDSTNTIVKYTISGTNITRSTQTTGFSSQLITTTVTWGSGDGFFHQVSNASYKKFVIATGSITSDLTHDFGGQTSLTQNVGGFGLSSGIMAQFTAGADMNDVGTSVGNVYAIMNPIKRL